MRDAVPEIRARGGELVVVGSGQPFHARAFRDERGLDFPLYVDPDLEAYAAAGLRRGATSTFAPRALGAAFRALRGGHRQGRVAGDPWQQGGALVIHPPADVRLHQVSAHAGDHVAVGDILDALAP